VDVFLRERGFEIYDLRRYFRKRKNTKDYGARKGRMVFRDALFFKGPERVLSTPSFTAEKLKRVICVYLCYKYPGIAETLLSVCKEKRALEKGTITALMRLLSRYESQSILHDFRGNLLFYDLLIHKVCKSVHKEELVFWHRSISREQLMYGFPIN